MMQFTHPIVGKECVVSTRFKSISIFNDRDAQGFSTFKVRGIVCKSNPWTPVSAFVLLVKEEGNYVPARQIELSSVIGLEYVDGSKAKKGPTPKVEANQVKVVIGSGGVAYSVSKEGGKLSCNCPGFTFRKKCKHTDNFDTLVSVA
jgi:hypothetical protein